jgi:hypothetical protein
MGPTEHEEKVTKLQKYGLLLSCMCTSYCKSDFHPDNTHALLNKHFKGMKLAVYDNSGYAI